MHRAEQIIDALVALQPAATAAFKHRTLSCGAEDVELPASSVRMGRDDPFEEDGASNLAFLDSLLDIEIDLLVQETDEARAIAALMQLRAAQHVAIMADRTLGLSNFVIDTRYQGADAPETEPFGEYTSARLTTVWQVHYRMNIGDPS